MPLEDIYHSYSEHTKNIILRMIHQKEINYGYFLVLWMHVHENDVMRMIFVNLFVANYYNLVNWIWCL